MKSLKILSSALLLSVLLSSCSFLPDPYEIDYDLLPQASMENETFKTGLYQYYRTWKSTPYKEGGTSRKGIDCSGLVQLVFSDLRRLHLPRTAEELQDLGYEVELYMLRPGDLLFFDTGMFSRHVGIHIENGRFLHVSSSKGVTISSLTNRYWSDTFEVAKRIDTLKE